MSPTKKVLSGIFLILIIAFFYNASAISLAPKSIILKTDPYISFRDDLTNAKYAVIQNNGSIQVNNLYTASIPLYAVSPAKMARDSLGYTHFVFSQHGYLDWTNNKVFYKSEKYMSMPPEVVPFPYGSGISSSFNGFSFGRPSLDMISNAPYVVVFGINYSQGQIINNKIMISKRTPAGWSPAVTLFQPSTLSPSREILLKFDRFSNGHIFYQVFTNQNCMGVNCPRSIYELVFSPNTFSIISNNLIATINGAHPEVILENSLFANSLNPYNYLGIIKIPDTSQSPNYNLYPSVSSSINSWTPQTLATSTVPIGETYATSLDIVIDFSGHLNAFASEKNSPLGTARLLKIVSSDNGITWSSSALLSSSTSQYNYVTVGRKYAKIDSEINIAYSEGSFGQSVWFDKIKLIKLNQGSQATSLIYQSPQGRDIEIGDFIL